MRKTISGAMLVLASTCSVAQISDQYTNCITRAKQNTVQVGVCAQKELTLQDGRLNRAYRSLMKAAPTAEDRLALKNDELAWIKYRDEKCKIDGDTVDNVCLLRETAKRAEKLKTPPEPPQK